MFPVAFTYLSSSFCPLPDCLSGCSKNMGETGGCLPSWFHPAKLLFEAAPLRRVLWDCPVIRNGLRWRLSLFKRRLFGELLVTFSWSTLYDYYIHKACICQSIPPQYIELSVISVNYIQFSNVRSLFLHRTCLLPCLRYYKTSCPANGHIAACAMRTKAPQFCGAFENCHICDLNAAGRSRRVRPCFDQLQISPGDISLVTMS